jgi:hypothetical protein
MSINGTITKSQRKTGGFATRMLTKALSERDKKNSFEFNRNPQPVSVSLNGENQQEEEKKLASSTSELTG